MYERDKYRPLTDDDNLVISSFALELERSRPRTLHS
jgi:hypothetical protein